MTKKKLEKEVWFEEIINKTDSIHYLAFVRKNIGMLRVPSNKLPRLLRKLDYRIREVNINNSAKSVEERYKK